jgi:transcriptional regulator NrdR family protein
MTPRAILAAALPRHARECATCATRFVTSLRAEWAPWAHKMLCEVVQP